MDLIFQALLIILQPVNFGLMVLAVFSGIIIGAIPGLTSAVAIGLLIPFTFSFEADRAFIILLGIYVGSMYGGSIPAVLMNLPGTPGAAVTAIDGYPMTKQGHSGEALGVSVFSSGVGGIISCLFLIFLSLQLARIALEFGGPEYFALCLFAIVIVFCLSGQSMIKGAIAAGLGLLIATVGIDTITPYPRFTFEVTELMIGMPMVPATIGLFCVAEAFRMIEAPGRIASENRAVSGLLAVSRTIPRLWRTLLQSGLIGTFIGILPGTGATVGSYMAYNAARATSKVPEKFGNGAAEGVCASESANNAVAVGALIPLMTLGIPGDINTLLLIGAMLIHGLIPGPTLFTENLVLVYVIFGTMVFSNLLIIVLGLTMTQWVARIANVEKKYLIPLVLVVAITGPAISYGHIYYFWVAIGFGLLGYFCEKGGFPPLAIAMSLILGPILEYNLRSSMMLPDASILMFMQRPISALFLVLTLAVIVYSIRREIRRWRARREPKEAEA
ncbi:MAG: tripartite tricarboxylate transporter permease [Rhodospirillales bacterium]|jgi:putative tricarboxylic transport membrane protein|nr:tripartite tricarboxylate transporter permease [Rhodospirillales bacterium]